MNQDVIDLPETPLAKVIEENKISNESGLVIQTAFKTAFEQVGPLVAEAQKITVTDATQVAAIKQSRSVRLKLKELRVEADKTRKMLKEDSLRTGRAIDGAYNVLLAIVKPHEERLEECEKFAERAEAKRIAELKAAREELLAPFAIDTAFYSLGEMPEETFAQLLESSRLAHESKIALARKAEEERIAAEAARVAEENRIREENAKLEAAAKAERAAREAAEAQAKAEREAIEAAARKEREEAERARLAAEAKAKKEREEAEAKARAEREAIEARAKAEREAAEAQAAEERKARERAEAELQAAKDAEAKRIADEEKARKRAAKAPDREKVKAIAASLSAIVLPQPASIELVPTFGEIQKRIADLAKWIEAQADVM